MTLRSLYSIALASIFFITFHQQACKADLILTAEGIAVLDEFDDFRGTGFSPTPSATQLDSNTYHVTGLSDGNGTFGGTHTTGDFARGDSTGGVTTGGTYAFDVGGGDFGVGFQPTGGDMTPGDFTIRVMNMTGVTLDTVEFNAEAYFFNDQPRSSRWTVELSLDDSSYTPITSIDSPEAADAVPSWQLNPIVTSTTAPMTISNGQQFFIRITGADLAGSGSRDEFVLANVSVTGRQVIPEPSSIALLSLASFAMVARRRRTN